MAKLKFSFNQKDSALTLAIEIEKIIIENRGAHFPAIRHFPNNFGAIKFYCQDTHSKASFVSGSWAHPATKWSFLPAWQPANSETMPHPHQLFHHFI